MSDDVKRPGVAGNWKRLPSGNLIYQVRCFVKETGKRKSKNFDPRKFGGQKAAAKAGDLWFGRVANAINDNTYRSLADHRTVENAVNLYITHLEARSRRKERMSVHNLKTESGQANRHILSSDYGMGALVLSKVRRIDVERFRDRLRDTGVSVITTRRVIGVLKRSLDYAILHEWIALNAAAGVRVITPDDAPTRKVVAPSKQDVRKVIDAADDDFKPWLIFAAATGVRSGEQRFLRWRHVDLDIGMLNIEGAIDPHNVEKSTKTQSGIRQIPLGDDTIKHLRRWRMRSKFSQNDDLMFPAPGGGIMSHSNLLNRRFKPIFARLEAAHDADPINTPEPPNRFNWHSLRHFCVSIWIEAGLTPKEVQVLAGHKNLSTTMNIYAHIFPSEDRKAAMDNIAKSLFS
ncbi:MAG: tyrosine-type recombinase/integrase [Magnetospiraceae bacterium]